jgi:hypothetical protein
MGYGLQKGAFRLDLFIVQPCKHRASWQSREEYKAFIPAASYGVFWPAE